MGIITSKSLALLLIFSTLVFSSEPQCPETGSKINEANRKSLLQSQMQFSVDLLREVNRLQPQDNVFLSPLSVYNALLLAYFVSANQTEDSLRELLRIEEDKDKNDILGAYTQEKYKQNLRSIKGSQNYQLSVANRMFVSSDQTVLPCVKKQFRDELESADLKTNLSATVDRINSWVSTQTRGNIKDLLSQDSLGPNTNLILVNAAYFQGIWKSQFSPSDTKEATFTLFNGTQVPVTMMSVEGKFNHKIDKNLSAEVIELPYEGDDISMFIILPVEPSTTDMMSLLNKTDAEILKDIVTSSSNTTDDISVAIPKFTVDLTLELRPVLEEMGVGDLFERSADLSSLTGSSGLKLDSAVHKAKVTVDETGTVAAAATAIFANRFSADSFVADHPFIYILYDKKNNILLFAGIFNSPDT